MSDTPTTDSTDTSTLDRVTSLLTDPFTSPPEADAAAGELCELVANERRRHVLRILAGGDSIRISDLADEVAARDAGCAVSNVESDHRKAVYVGLHQNHIPRLVDAGLVSRERDVILPEPGIDAALDVYRTASAVSGGESA